MIELEARVKEQVANDWNVFIGKRGFEALEIGYVFNLLRWDNILDRERKT